MAVPVPDDPKLYCPGWAFNSAMNSRMVRTGSFGLTTITGAKRVISDTAPNRAASRKSNPWSQQRVRCR